MPVITAVIIVAVLLGITIASPEGYELIDEQGNVIFQRGPLPTTIDLDIAMYGVLVFAVLVVFYSLKKVSTKYTGKMALAFNFIVGGAILFAAVTIMDLFIHQVWWAEYGATTFNHTTHLVWHVLEWVGMAFIFWGMKNLADLIAGIKKVK